MTKKRMLQDGKRSLVSCCSQHKCTRASTTTPTLNTDKIIARGSVLLRGKKNKIIAEHTPVQKGKQCIIGECTARVGPLPHMLLIAMLMTC